MIWPPNNLEDVAATKGGFSHVIKSLLTNLANTGRSEKQAVSMSLDGLLAVFCLWVAYSLRFNEIFRDFQSTWHLFLLVPVISVLCFAGLGVYRWVIRSINQRLFHQLIKGSVLSSLVLLVAFFLLPPDRVNPRSIFVIYGILFFVSTAGFRVVWESIFQLDTTGEPVAIYGAGDAGQRLAILLTVDSLYRPVMFIDDDEALVGSTLCGLPVCRATDSDIESQLKSLEVNKIILAMPRLSAADYHRKLQMLEPLGIGVLTTPSIDELTTGRARPEEIRDVTITDILGRSEVAGNVELMSTRVSGKVVLVTGGGGSIGSELCRQILHLGPEQLIILDNSEANLYQITEELTQQLEKFVVPEIPMFTPLLGSIRDRAQVNRLLSEFNVDTIFHAAAYKHVPIVEAQPEQGVGVNVFGTRILLESAVVCGVSDFVLISTDKAVRPTNAMGASKRVAELVLQAWAARKTGTRISMVRFGNVLGSSGSVVPKFKRQILDGGPITLTHSDVTRYFMTIPEAAQLVLQASAVAQGGEVFVLDMGEPVRIEELAITMVKLYGKRLQRDTGDPADIEIHVKGLRPGEKLYEELFITKDHKKTAVEKITAARESWIEWGELNSELKTLETLCEKGDSKNLRRHIMKLAFTTQGLTVDKLNGQVVAAETCENMQETIDSSVIS